MSSPPLWGPLKRSSTSVLRIPGIQRQGRCPYSAAAATGAGEGGTAAAGYVGVKGPSPSPSPPDRDIGGFLKAVTGIAACGSGMALWFASSSSPPSVSPVSSPSETSFLGRADLEDGDELAPEAVEEKKPRYLFGDAYRRKVFFNYEKRIRMLSPPEKVSTMIQLLIAFVLRGLFLMYLRTYRG